MRFWWQAKLTRLHLRAACAAGAAIIFCSIVLLAGCGPPTLAQKIDVYLWEKHTALAFSGSVLVAMKGEIILRKGYGLADYERGIVNTPETKHRICSISKVLTNLGVLTLCERGLISLDDTVARFYDDFPNGDSITLRHLLEHTAGLYDIHNDDPDFEREARRPKSLDDLIAAFKDKPLKWPPGTAYGYSNSGYILLAGIIEKVTGKSYGEYLEEALFLPLGMYSSGDYRNQHVEGLAVAYTVHGDKPERTDDYHWSNFTGSGSVYSTVDDLYRLHRALMEGEIVSKESIGRGGDFLVAFGYLPGLSSGMLRYPSQDLVVIVLGNLSDTIDGICYDIATMALTHGAKAPEQRDLERYTGKYETPDGAMFDVELRKGRLIVSLAGTQELLPLGTGPDGLFLMGNVIVQFVETETGMEMRMPDYEATPAGSLCGVRIEH